MEAIKLTDILDYKFLSEPRFSPNGRRAAFVVSEANEEENTYESRLWLLEEGRLKQMSDIGRERGFVWLDDDRLLFPAARTADERKRAEAHEEFASYYVLDVTGGEARRLFELPFAVRGLKVIDGTHFAVSGVVDKLFPDLWKGGKEAADEAKKQRDDEKDYEVFDELPFWSNGGGVTNGKRSERFRIIMRMGGYFMSPVMERATTMKNQTRKGFTGSGIVICRLFA